ncbi:MAG: cupin domain-containing protein [Syntrophomonadaceae bacterium]
MPRYVGPLSEPVALASLVEWQEDSIVSKTLVKRGGGNITAFAFAAGQGLSEHTAPFDAMVVAVEGRGEITLEGCTRTLENGQALLMPAGVPHSVMAREAFKMLLIMIKA